MTILKTIPYWLESAQTGKAQAWLQEAVSRVSEQPEFDHLIAYFAGVFRQKGYLQIDSALFRGLVNGYAQRYAVASLCAEMLYQAGSFQAAADLYARFFADPRKLKAQATDELKIMNDLVCFAAASLEIDRLEWCQIALNRLIQSEAMTDTAQALRFYICIKKRDLEKGIAILDAWIRERKLEINETLNNISDLTRVILRMAELMGAYRQTNAAAILGRSCHHIIETLSLEA
jgi:hypothetical protein